MHSNNKLKRILLASFYLSVLGCDGYYSIFDLLNASNCSDAPYEVNDLPYVSLGNEDFEAVVPSKVDVHVTSDQIVVFVA